MPQTSVHVVPSSATPPDWVSPGTPPIAPAVANAVARLTGKRLQTTAVRLERRVTSSGAGAAPGVPLPRCPTFDAAMIVCAS